MAVAAKSKAPAYESIMAPERMKPLLTLSKREPVQAAIGLTTDGDGLILLDKKMKPRKVLSELRNLAGKAKLQLQTASLRFGRAEVDVDYDPATIRFFINKDAPGNMRPRLIEVVKKASYQKVEFHVDPSLEEADDDEAPGQAQDAPPGLDTEPQLDAEALKRELATLAGRIGTAAGTDAARKAALAKLAGDANGKLKANDLEAAGTLLRQLAGMLDGGGTTPTEAPKPTGAVNYGKCRLLWVGTRKKIEGDIDRLVTEVRQAFDKDTGDTLAAQFKLRVAPVMAGFDETLTDKLDEALNQTDPAKHATLVAEARQIVDRYQAFLGSEQLIGKLDQNTLMPLSIAKTMGAALNALSASLR